MVSWEYWHYCECQDPTTAGSGVQAVVVDPSRSPTGSNVKRAKLDVLSEPYPQLVAGTPRGWRFDPATRIFHLTYSTKGPGGKRFARRAGNASKRSLKTRRTEIFLGWARYPKGYRVSVRGGGIASKPKAGVLKTVACPRRRKVTVTVGPPGSGVHKQTELQDPAQAPELALQLLLVLRQRHHLGGAGGAENAVARRSLGEGGLLLGVGEPCAAVVAAVGQLLDAPLLELHGSSVLLTVCAPGWLPRIAP